MAKKQWLIEWNASGQNGNEDYDMVETETEEEARMIAYEAARESFENTAHYDAKLMTAELAEEHGFDFEESAAETMTAPTHHKTDTGA